MKDAEILEAISQEYGEQLETLTPAQKVGLLGHLACQLHGYAPGPAALYKKVETLSPQSARILMDSLTAQLMSAQLKG